VLPKQLSSRSAALRLHHEVGETTDGTNVWQWRHLTGKIMRTMAAAMTVLVAATKAIKMAVAAAAVEH